MTPTPKPERPDVEKLALLMDVFDSTPPNQFRPLVTWIEHLEQQLRDQSADAARYRFLRDYKCKGSGPMMDGVQYFHFGHGGWPPLKGQTLEQAVDAAIEELKRESIARKAGDQS